MVELDSHAAEVRQQLVGVGLLCENAERTLQSFQLAGQLDVLLRLEGDDCRCRCGLEMNAHVKSHSDRAHDARTNDDGACQPVTFLRRADGKKNNLLVLLGFCPSTAGQAFTLQTFLRCQRENACSGVFGSRVRLTNPRGCRM